MMQQTKMMPQSTKPLVRPKRFDVFFHAIKTCKLVGSLLVDRRVPIVRKVFFLGSIGALLVVLLFPDVLGEFVLSTVLPFVGTVLGVPIDAGFDWVAFAMVVVTLLRFFPAEIVSEHYRSIFG
ncbi:MAG: hypothetical protein JOZ18_16670 [Chloroflexi bacterium]|nr:hypothetical protein [Chloroflexota bacterium]